MTREEKITLLDDLLEIEEKNDIGNLTRSDRAEFQMWVKALEQEPFINKPCVSEKTCEHDKNVVLDKIRAEIQENINYNKKMNYQGIVAGLLLTLAIIDKYKAESEVNE